MLLLLFGLIFRGVAFEFRYRGSARGLWDWGFFVGSTIAAFVQGAAVGAMVRGIPVVNGQYAGGRFEWLAPLPVFTGIGLVLGYALLGAGWLVMKSEGALREWAWPRVPRLAAAVLVVLALAAVASIVERDRVIDKVFLGRTWGLVFPAIGLLAMYGVFAGAPASPRRLAVRHDGVVLPGVVRNARSVVLALHDSLFHHRGQRGCARGVAFVPVLGRGLVRAAGDRDLHHCRLLALPRQDADGYRVWKTRLQANKGDANELQARTSSRRALCARAPRGGADITSSFADEARVQVGVGDVRGEILSLFAPPGAVMTEDEPKLQGRRGARTAAPASPSRRVTGQATTKR